MDVKFRKNVKKKNKCYYNKYKINCLIQNMNSFKTTIFITKFQNGY